MFLHNIFQFQGHRTPLVAVIFRSKFRLADLKNQIFRDFEIRSTWSKIQICLLFNALSRYYKEKFFCWCQILTSFIYSKIHHSLWLVSLYCVSLAIHFSFLTSKNLCDQVWALESKWFFGTPPLFKSFYGNTILSIYFILS